MTAVIADASARAADRLDLDTLVDIVGGLARAEPLWRPHVAHDPTDRVRRRLLATPAYEVWLLGWTPGQSVGLHDHGDANGAFVVVDGELAETGVVASRLDEQTLVAGGFGIVPAGARHDVANRSSRNATSIHAYSRPLREMGFYRRDGSLERIDAVHEQSALLAADVLADPGLRRALHPAAGGTIMR